MKKSGESRRKLAGINASVYRFFSLLSAPSALSDALRSFADCLRVGLLWVVLTLAFEWNFGRFVTGRSWASILAEYNLSHGGLMPVGLAILR